MHAWLPEAVIYEFQLGAIAAREPRNALEAAREPDTLSSPLAFLHRGLDALGHLGVNTLLVAAPFPSAAGPRGTASPAGSSSLWTRSRTQTATFDVCPASRSAAKAHRRDAERTPRAGTP